MFWLAAELPGFTAQVNLSPAEIKRLADRIIAKAKETYDSVAAVPLDKVCLQLVMPLHFTHGAVLWNVAFIWKFICGFGLIYVCRLLSLEKKYNVQWAHTALKSWELSNSYTLYLQVSFANVVAPLAELDALQFPLVQACVLPRMVSTSEDVRKASAEAEKRLDSYFVLCRCNVITHYFLFIHLDVTVA